MDKNKKHPFDPEREKIENLGGMSKSVNIDEPRQVSKQLGRPQPGWENDWRGVQYDAADGTYPQRGEMNRWNFKKIIQQPAQPTKPYTSTTVSN